jgi:hypothetical protein
MPKRLATLALALAAARAQVPNPLWSVGLGLNGTLSDGAAVFSPDGASLYTVESYLGYSKAQSWSLSVAGFNAATGTRKWSWTPQISSTDTTRAPYMKLVLSADGATLFVLGPINAYGGSVAAVNTATGALAWGPTAFDLDSSYATIGTGLPATTASGDLCFKAYTSNAITCLAAATGATRYSIPIQNYDSVGLDPARLYLVTLSTTLVQCYGTPTGVLLWQSELPDGVFATSSAEVSATALFAVTTNPARNTASLYAWSLLDGSAPAGLPALLPSSEYMTSKGMAITPAGALLLTRFGDAYGQGSLSLALLDAVSGAERWVFTLVGYPYPALTRIFSADGALFYVSGACGNSAEWFTCKGASLSAVSVATGKLVFAAAFADAAIVVPFSTDATTGGVIALTFSALTYSTTGLTPSGATAWVLLANELAAFSAAARRVAYVVAPTAGTGATSTLVCAALPVPAAAGRAAVPTAVLVGGLVGAAALATAGAAAYFNRAALRVLLGGSSGGGGGVGEGSALLLGGARAPAQGWRT